MPGNANDGLNAERFAALWAGCDAGNANEAEALSKFRVLRRMVIAENLRIVDAMGRADVMRALDAQLKPVREESPELKAAFLQVAQLAELANERQELIDELQQENARLKDHIEKLRSDPDAIEHEAREKLHYAKPGEVIYTLPAPVPGPAGSGK